MSRLAGYSSELAEKIAVETAALKDNEEVMRAIVEIQKEYNELRGQDKCSLFKGFLLTRA